MMNKSNGPNGPKRKRSGSKACPGIGNGSTSKHSRIDPVTTVTIAPAGKHTLDGEPGTTNVEKQRLCDSFYTKPCKLLATSLLGKLLVRKIGDERITGRIVETEAYLGLEDKAAHSYKGKRTNRTEAMYMKPGTAYVYNIYGMYCCFNISSAGEGCAVLIRALEPEQGIPEMRTARYKGATKAKKEKELTNGPSKLCQALQITKDSCNQIDLSTSDSLWIENGEEVKDCDIVKCPRINIGYAEDWVDKHLRFYIENNLCVSVKYKG